MKQIENTPASSFEAVVAHCVDSYALNKIYMLDK